MNMRFFSMALLLLFAGCGGRAVYLDGDRIDAGWTNSNSSPDAIAPKIEIVVEDQKTAIRIAVDETQIY